MLLQGGHAIIYCSARQIGEWLAVFDQFNDMITDQVALNLARRPYCFYHSPATKSTALQNVVDTVIHTTKAGAGRAGHDMVHYRVFNRDLSRHPGYVNLIDNLPKLAIG